MKEHIDIVVNNIINLKQNRVFIGIDGRSGSGKSTFAQEIKNRIVDSTIIHLDSFDLYKSKESFDRVVSEVFDLKENINSKFIIVEGVFALSKAFRKYYSYSIWIELSEKEGFKKGLQRDISMNGIDNSDKWSKYWLPKERKYIIAEKPKRYSNYIIDLS